jgi:arabinofuranosyltransferase
LKQSSENIAEGNAKESKIWVLAFKFTLAAFIIGQILHMGTHDDAYITFRCCANFAEGHGLVFNVGEKVEAFSSFLFGVLVALGMKYSQSGPLPWAFLLNYAGFFFILVLLTWLARRSPLSEGNDKHAYWGVWFAALHPSLWIFNAFGLETVFFAALFFAGFAFLVLHLEKKVHPVWSGVFFALAADVRMEAAAFAGLAALCVFLFGEGSGLLEKREIKLASLFKELISGFRSKRFADAVFLTVGFFVLFVPVLAFRWNYYGYPFPNPYYAKVDGGGLDLAYRGGTYVLSWLAFNPVIIWVVYLCYQSGMSAALRLRTILGLTFVAAYCVYNIYVGGDYLPHHRFFIPLIPVIGFLLGDLLRLRINKLEAETPEAVAKMRMKWRFVLIGFGLWTCFNPVNYQTYLQQCALTKNWIDLGVAMKKHIAGDYTLYLDPTGAIPYYSGLRAYDTYGLVDPVVAHMKTKLGKGIPGHEKKNFTRIMELDPDFLLVGILPIDVKEIESLPEKLLAEVGKQMKAEKNNPVDVKGKVIKHLLAQSLKKWQFFTQKSFLDRYELMHFKDSPNTAAFFVKRSLPDAVKTAFEPIKLPLEIFNGEESNQPGVDSP